MASKSEDLLEAWGALFVAHGLAVKQIEAEISASAALTLDEYDVLLGISRAPEGKLRYSALASATVFTRSGITRVTTRLEKRGLLARAECPEDRRGAYATLTPKGREALRGTWKQYSKAILSLLEPCLGQVEAKRLKVSLEKIIAQIKGVPLVQIGSTTKNNCAS